MDMPQEARTIPCFEQCSLQKEFERHKVLFVCPISVEVQVFVTVVSPICPYFRLFQFDGCRWLARAVIEHAIDAADFIDDARCDL